MKRYVAENKNKALFLLNPTSGVPPLNFIVSKELERRKNELSCCKSMNKEETGTLIKQNFDKYNVFIAAGGDGTVHTVAHNLLVATKSLAFCHLVQEMVLQRNLDLK